MTRGVKLSLGTYYISIVLKSRGWGYAGYWDQIRALPDKILSLTTINWQFMELVDEQIIRKQTSGGAGIEKTLTLKMLSFSPSFFHALLKSSSERSWSAWKLSLHNFFTAFSLKIGARWFRVRNDFTLWTWSILISIYFTKKIALQLVLNADIN